MGYKEQTYELLKDFKQGLIDDETFFKKSCAAANIPIWVLP